VVNSSGQILATVATLAVIPKISSRRPKLGQYCTMDQKKVTQSQAMKSGNYRWMVASIC
jgi:hypothetical protein